MPVIVVLSNCPPKLRGDMTKWLFEINTGVYVGNISARVRENLWLRITENIGRGHATMVYSASGEQRMDFRVHNAYWEPVDYDGIKMMRRPERASLPPGHKEVKTGFSTFSKQRIAATHTKKRHVLDAFLVPDYVVLDFETTGLDVQRDEIIEIAALLVERGQIAERMQTFVCSGKPVPKEITHLTGITDEDLKLSGKPLAIAIRQLLEFVEDLPLVCHHAAFEQAFLQEACRRMDEEMENRFIDTQQMAQIMMPNLDNYKLSTLANHFKLDCTGQHRAMADCEATYGVYGKLMELVVSEERKSEK
ncbi:MAG: type I-E CRISPR-associated endoribonuclease Cas2 [Clostridiales bacterium]|nr:type I-E CRISPR-associated endoribonuclease Cas2 [Candidatus Cacconaster stercorequi]